MAPYLLSLCAWLGIALGCLAAAPCMAQTSAPISADILRAPPRAAELVATSQHDVYRKVLAAYAQEEQAHAADMSLVKARCEFIGTFADSEDLAWAEDALADYQACQKDLETRFQGDAEASLYVAEHRYGKDALAYVRKLLPVSAYWTTQQQARLHGALSRIYTGTNQPALAAQEALAAVRLDPGSDQLVAALRHLCETGHRDEAEALLAKAPAPSHAWVESQRVRLAADKMSPSAALAELQRAEAAKAQIDPWLTARIYLQAGESAKAADALGRVKVASAYQSVEQLQLRLNVAAAQKDGKAASAALQDWLGRTGVSTPMLVAYAGLLAQDPRQLFSAPLMPLALSMLGLLVFLACLPGLLVFPAHYRGTVRARLQKPTSPLFDAIGLQRMWLGLGGFLLAATLVPMLGSGKALQAIAGHRPMAGGEEGTILAVQLAILLAGGVFLLPAGWRLSRQAWLGDRGLKASLIIVLGWALLKALVVWALAHAGHLGELTHDTVHDQSVTTLIAAADHVGGAGLAMLLIAVLVPFYEELLFRGLILGGLSRHLSFGWSNAWQAFLFALAHYDAKHFVFYFVLGLLGGWLVRRTRGLAAPIALHVANNVVACAAVLLAG
jgi:membrane protease YdiL (CAAX protease family)